MEVLAAAILPPCGGGVAGGAGGGWFLKFFGGKGLRASPLGGSRRCPNLFCRVRGTTPLCQLRRHLPRKGGDWERAAPSLPDRTGQSPTLCQTCEVFVTLLRNAVHALPILHRQRCRASP